MQRRRLARSRTAIPSTSSKPRSSCSVGTSLAPPPQRVAHDEIWAATAWWPRRHAIWNGVAPCQSSALCGASAARRRETMALWPEAAARWSGVRPPGS